MRKRQRDPRHAVEVPEPGRCPACNMSRLERDGEGAFCPNCLYTPSPPITLEAAVEKAEAVAVAESRALREELAREGGAHRRRAA
jgi:uncharacterized Zn finger protein (UPF0148 family)